MLNLKVKIYNLFAVITFVPRLSSQDYPATHKNKLFQSSYYTISRTSIPKLRVSNVPNEAKMLDFGFPWST